MASFSVVMQGFSAVTSSGLPKPSLNAAAGIVTLPPLVTEECDNPGGTFEIASTGNNFTMTATNCVDEQTTFNGFINGNFDPNNPISCSVNDETFDLPRIVNVTDSNFTANVSVDSTDVSTTVTGLQMAFNISAYDSADCGPQLFTADITGGTIAGPLATVSFPPNTLTLDVETILDVQAEHRQAYIGVNGTFDASSSTQCIDGSFGITTEVSLFYPDTNDLCPQDGWIFVEDLGDGSTDSVIFSNGGVSLDVDNDGSTDLELPSCLLAQACVVPSLDSLDIP